MLTHDGHKTQRWGCSEQRLGDREALRGRCLLPPSLVAGKQACDGLDGVLSLLSTALSPLHILLPP